MRNAFGISFAAALAFHGAVSGLVWRLGGTTAAPSDPAPMLAGETFELPAPDFAEQALASASPSPLAASEIPSPGAAREDGVARAETPRAKPAARNSAPARPSGGRTTTAPHDPGGSGSSALFGAVGDRSASDLATAFTRGFPQAASADPAWRNAPFGGAGEATLTLVIDETGHLVTADVGGAPGAALASGIRRTIALVRGRTFVARAKTTRLLLSATVSPDTVHDGLHGDVFAIGGSFVAPEGSAFFALAIGRRVDLRVRAR